MTVRIVTDSTCDLPPELAAEHSIRIVPTYINVGEQSFRDGFDLTREDFYRRLPTYDPYPTTAAPGPGAFQAVYEQLAAQGASAVLSIHIAENLSAVAAAARLGASEVTSIPVVIFDSQQLSMGLGFQALAAAELAAAGKGLEAIQERLRDQIPRTLVSASLESLEYLRRSGRVSSVIAGLGNLLQVKPIVLVQQGEITIERVRTRQRALEQVAELLEAQAPFERLALVHTHAAEALERFRTRVGGLLPAGDVLTVDVTPVIGTHSGPGAVGFAAVRASA